MRGIRHVPGTGAEPGCRNGIRRGCHWCHKMRITPVDGRPLRNSPSHQLPTSVTSRDNGEAGGGGLCTFQSTRPRGARRRYCSVTSSVRFLFQSTRPRGARHGSVCTSDPTCRKFQSTRPRGARQTTAMYLFDREEVSIHAPARGATGCTQNLPLKPLMFQSTRPRGARRIQHTAGLTTDSVSIHAPARGATSGDAAIELWSEIYSFNPRARAGRDVGRWKQDARQL